MRAFQQFINSRSQSSVNVESRPNTDFTLDVSKKKADLFFMVSKKNVCSLLMAIPNRFVYSLASLSKRDKSDYFNIPLAEDCPLPEGKADEKKAVD